jgi:hypothetical protein
VVRVGLSAMRAAGSSSGGADSADSADRGTGEC